MKPSSQISISLLLGIMLFASLGRAQTVVAPVYFYITSDPAIFQQAFTPILPARTKQFNEEKVMAEYQKFLQRSIGEGWFKYAHHGFVHGPFNSEAEAKDDYSQQERKTMEAGGRAIYPRELVGFRYRDASLLVVVVSVPPKTPEAGALDVSPMEKALTGLPIAVYFPLEYTWKDAVGGSSSITMSVGELHPSAALIWVEPNLSLSSNSAGTRLLQEQATNVLSSGLDLLVALPARSRDAAEAAVARFKTLFAENNKRIEVAVAEDAAMRATMSRRLMEFLAPPIIPLKVNELMANNTSVVKGEGGDFPDWVEILNTGTVAIDLAGMYASDNEKLRPRRRISGADRTKTTVPSGGRLVLWLDGRSTLGPNHMDLRLSSRGERFTLVDIDALTVIDQVEFGPQAPDKSYARVPDGGEKWQSNREPTPGITNR